MSFSMLNYVQWFLLCLCFVVFSFTVLAKKKKLDENEIDETHLCGKILSGFSTDCIRRWPPQIISLAQLTLILSGVCVWVCMVFIRNDKYIAAGVFTFANGYYIMHYQTKFILFYFPNTSNENNKIKYFHLDGFSISFNFAILDVYDKIQILFSIRQRKIQI